MAPFYIFSVFVISYGALNLGYSKTSVLNSISAAAVVATIHIPLAGRLSDRLGRKTLYLTGTALLMAYAVPYFLLLSQRSLIGLYAATVIGLGILWVPITAVLGTLFSEIFRTGVRYTGVTIGYQLGATLAGGTAPLVATRLLQEFDNSWVPIAVYMMITGAISFVAVSLARPVESAGQPTPGA